MYIRIHVWRGLLKLRTDCDFTPWFQQTHLNDVACGTRFCSDLYVVFQQSTVSVWYLLTCSVFCLYRHFFPCVLFFYNDKLSRLGVGYILKWLIFCLFYVLPLVCCRCWDCTGCFILKIDQMHCAVWLPAWLDLICAVLHSCCPFALKKKKKRALCIFSVEQGEELLLGCFWNMPWWNHKHCLKCLKTAPAVELRLEHDPDVSCGIWQ